MLATEGRAAVRKTGAGWEVSAGELSLNLSEDGGLVSVKEHGRVHRGGGGAFVIDAEMQVAATGAPTPATGVRASVEDGKLVISRTLPGGKAAVRSEIESNAERILWTVSMANRGQKDGFYNLGIDLPVAYSTSWSFWDGYAQPAHKDPKGRKGINYVSGAVFPMACVYSGGNGMALGFEPFQLVAAMESSVSPTRPPPNGRGQEGLWRLRYQTRVVLAAGKEFSVKFVLFPFAEKYGHLDAVQRYYDLFPAAFEPRREINPMCDGMEFMSIYYRYAYDPGWPDYQGEMIRRISHGRGGWEWLYRPGIYPGDWGLLDPDGVTSRYFGPGHKPFTHDPQGTGPTFSAYKQRVRVKCTSGRRHLVAPGFYMNFVWCGEELAKKHLPDALVDAANNPKHRLDEKWWYDYKNDREINSKYVFASGTNWGDFGRKSIQNVVETFAPSAICFDSASGVEKIYGPASSRAAVRAFDDDKRPYSLQAVAYADLMDYCRSLRNERGEQVAAIPNWHQSGAYPVAFRADTILLERHPMQWQSWAHIYPQLKRHRMVAGRKTITMNRSYTPKHLRRFQWDKLDAQQTLDAFREVRDETLLCCAQFGILPGAPLICGTEKIYNAMPLLFDLADAGWEPSPKSFVTNGRLELSRFGKGVGGFYVLVNHHKTTEKTTFTADRMSGAHVVLASYDGGPLVNRMQADVTRVEVTVKPRTYVAFRRAALARGLPTGTKVSVSHDDVKFRQRMLRLDIQLPQPKPLEWTLPVPANYTAHSVTAAGETVRFTRDDDECAIRFRTPSARGALHMEVVFEPAIKVKGDLEDLYKFDFMADPPPACITVPKDYKDEDYNDSAWRIGEYFRYYSRRVLKKEEPVKLAIHEADPARTAPFFIILQPIAASSPGTIEIGDFTVHIRGDRQTLPKAVLKFLAILDRKYPYYGTFMVSSAHWLGATGKNPCLTRAGLEGRALKGEIGDPLE